MCALNINPFINNLSHCIYISFHWPPQKCPGVFVIPRACIPQPRCNLLKPRLYFFREGSPPRFQGGQAQLFQNMAKMPSRAQVRKKVIPTEEAAYSVSRSRSIVSGTRIQLPRCCDVIFKKWCDLPCEISEPNVTAPFPLTPFYHLSLNLIEFDVWNDGISWMRFIADVPWCYSRLTNCCPVLAA